MKRAELNALKAKIADKKDKADDLDIIMAEVMALPYGQLKKVLTEPVMAVLERHGYTNTEK